MLGSIDSAAHVLQRRARDVLLGSAVFMVPMLALNTGLAVLAFNEFDRFDSVFGQRGYVGVETGFAFVAIVVQSFTAHLIGAYAATYLVRYQMGGDPRIRECVGAVLRRLPLLLATWLLTHWWALLLALALLNADMTTVAGVGWMLGFGVAALSALVLLTAPVVMAERAGLRSVPRAVRLARTRYGAAFGFVLSCGLLAWLLMLFIGFLPDLAEATGLITFGSYGWLMQGISSQLALLVVVPFSAITTAQFYLQVRVHAEGLDIVMAADRAFGAQP